MARRKRYWTYLKMNRSLVAFAGVVVAGLIGATPLMAESPGPIILDRDEKALFPQLKQAADINDRVAGILGSKEFKLVKVEALKGQNPFDPVEPFFNLDGERVENFEQLKALLAGNGNNNNNGGNGDFAGCIGTFTSGQFLDRGSVTAEFSIAIDEATGLCVAFLTTDGESFGVTLNQGQNILDAFAFGKFTLIQPANARLPFGAGTVQTRNNDTGTVFTITVNTVKTSDNPPEFRITITNIVAN